MICQFVIRPSGNAKPALFLYSVQKAEFTFKQRISPDKFASMTEKSMNESAFIMCIHFIIPLLLTEKSDLRII